MSKIDALLSDFDAAVMRAQSWNREDLPAWAHRRAGLVAVLERLQSNMVSKMEREELNEILGNAENEKAAGGRGENPDVPGTSQMQTPAAPTAAPETCEWSGALSPRHRYQTGCGAWFHHDYKQCQGCGKPIKFKETT